MRHTVETYLAGTAVISTATKATDGQGGYIWTYAASGTVDARLSPLRGDEVQIADRLGEVNAMILTLPNATSINADDRLTYDSVTYEVRHVATRIPWEL